MSRPSSLGDPCPGVQPPARASAAACLDYHRDMPQYQKLAEERIVTREELERGLPRARRARGQEAAIRTDPRAPGRQVPRSGAPAAAAVAPAVAPISSCAPLPRPRRPGRRESPGSRGRRSGRRRRVRRPARRRRRGARIPRSRTRRSACPDGSCGVGVAIAASVVPVASSEGRRRIEASTSRRRSLRSGASWSPSPAASSDSCSGTSGCRSSCSCRHAGGGRRREHRRSPGSPRAPPRSRTFAPAGELASLRVDGAALDRRRPRRRR